MVVNKKIAFVGCLDIMGNTKLIVERKVNGLYLELQIFSRFYILNYKKMRIFIFRTAKYAVFLYLKLQNFHFYLKILHHFILG